MNVKKNNLFRRGGRKIDFLFHTKQLKCFSYFLILVVIFIFHELNNIIFILIVIILIILVVLFFIHLLLSRCLPSIKSLILLISNMKSISYPPNPILPRTIIILYSHLYAYTYLPEMNLLMGNDFKSSICSCHIRKENHILNNYMKL